MSVQQPSLADQVARVRASALGTPAPIFLPDLLHAAIMALLARILGRLEDMIRLWQAGLLPPPKPRTPRRQSPRPHARPRARRHSRARRTSRTRPAASPPRQRPATAHATPARDHAITQAFPTKPTHTARAPPPGTSIPAQMPCHAGASTHALNITISKQKSMFFFEKKNQKTFPTWHRGQ
jgi:hypothetical protein